MPILTRLDDDLWITDHPHRFMGLHLGARMTVVRLPSGDLWLHSPVRLTDELRAELDALGPVRYAVGPNLYHHVYLGDIQSAYPECELLGVPGLAKKRKDLRFAHELTAAAPRAWADVIDQQPIEGCMLGETVFLHRPSRTLISADLVEWFEHCDHWPTRVYLKASGIYGKPALGRLLRPLFRDRKRARACIDRILAWDFDRVILAHGRIVDHGGPQIVRQTYAWL